MCHSFHLARESIATKIEDYLFIDGKDKPDDVLTKHWARHDIRPTLKPIFFLSGDTMDCLNNNNLSFEDGE